MLSRSLEDHVVEPYRSQLIPHFKEVKQAVLDSGALGCSISGAGPSIFTLNKGLDSANRVKRAMQNIYEKTTIDFEILFFIFTSIFLCFSHIFLFSICEMNRSFCQCELNNLHCLLSQKTSPVS